ncbi:hypothetical protein [Acinetobacter bereziniae]|uniref:hypothetical protein n=1 Tax=Acinetobacter bereziniae TaxID=106648 RepID=UPI000C2B5A40|nr:hypothetical protein [Acinetobacter bereziniae]ATZ65133.1 hypothetical protein BSR55_18280 [Acinetobacter bereziniae]
MGVGGASPTVGTSCTTCLKKFLVHFRRPQDYSGNYGFDWLRDDYIYANKFIAEASNAKKPLCVDVQKLKNEYKNDVKNPISPYGQEYFPAWLSLFSYIEDSNSPHISKMTKDGVKLDLFIEEIEPLSNDGTELIFECQNNFIQLSPKQIPLVNALKKKVKDSDGKKQYYHLARSILIKCQGGWLNDHEEIKVFAKKGSVKVEVGKLMLYKNSIVKHADIILIPVVTEYRGGKPVLPDRVDAYEYLIKRIAFNQALIRAEIKREAVLDLTKYQNDPLVNFIQGATSKTQASNFARVLRELYNKYGPIQVNGGIDQNGNGISNSKKTFVFLTTKQTEAGGVCTLDGHVWGDMVIVFKSNLNHAHSYPHELGHSFSLPHTFQKGSMAKHTFYRGSTENYMDYMTDSLGNNNPFHTDKKSFTFFKWQWDIMRQDKSMN